LLITNNFMSSLLCACKRLAIFGSLLAIPALIHGQGAFAPGGNNYPIAGALAGDQTFPQAAINATGGWLVWQDNSAGDNGLAIKAARLDGSSNISGSPFLVSSATAKSKKAKKAKKSKKSVTATSDQGKPQVALLPEGGAVIVWQSGFPGAQKIYARFLAADGSFDTKDIMVNTYRNGFQIDPAVVVLSDGSVVVIWSSGGQDGSLQGIYGQRLSGTGSKLGVKLGSEFRINQWTANNQRSPALTALADGGFVAVWVSELQRGSSSVDVYARIFNAAGGAVSGEFPVNPEATRICANPSVTGSPQGGFAAAWSQKDDVVRGGEGEIGGLASTSKSTNSWDVFVRTFEGNGAPATAPSRINTHTYGDQYAPRISACAGRYLVVWTSLAQDGSREGVFGQFLTGNGGSEGAELQVNTTSVSRQIQPVIATDGANQLLVVWSSFGAGTSFDLFARSYLKP